MNCDYEIVELFKNNPELMSEKSKCIIDFVNNYMERKNLDKKIQKSKDLSIKRKLCDTYFEMGIVQNELFEKALNAYQDMIEFGIKNGQYLFFGYTLKDMNRLSHNKTINSKRDEIKKSLFKSMLEYYYDLGEIDKSKFYGELSGESKSKTDKCCQYLNETKRNIIETESYDIFNEKKELGEYLALSDINVVKKYIDKATEEDSKFDIRDRIMKMTAYRSLRHKQAYYADTDSNHYSRAEVERLDRYRRQTHNEALYAFLQTIIFGRENGLPSLLIGDELTLNEIFEHSKNREQMTNAMFDFLQIVEKGRLFIDKESRGGIVVDDIVSAIDKKERDEAISFPIRRDEDGARNGGIMFYE